MNYGSDEIRFVSSIKSPEYENFQTTTPPTPPAHQVVAKSFHRHNISREYNNNYEQIQLKFNPDPTMMMMKMMMMKMKM